MARKLPYKEGDWFAVPLRDGGFALGVVARMDGKGAVIAYLFGPRSEALPSLEAVGSKRATDAVLVANTGDLGLLRGEWPVLGKVDPWEREAWPVPVFVRRSVVSNTPKKVIYREPDFNIEAEILPCTEEEARQLPKDGILGYGAVEIRLTTLLTRE
ncbi:MAG TPA: Imm26 family immunity protein [Thermoanaerobaculaceae bacterium]|nr:Imm26 family immunity protein [Thermoanaerobaculaceae bacterium]